MATCTLQAFLFISNFLHKFADFSHLSFKTVHVRITFCMSHLCHQQQKYICTIRYGFKNDKMDALVANV